jgi:sulfur-oxidizing protein SoxX
MRHFTRTLAVLALTASPILTSPVLTGPAWAEEVAPADVVFDEYGAVAKSLTGVPGDPAKGAEVMASKKIGNCVACHAVAQLSDSSTARSGPNSAGRAKPAARPSCGGSS